MYVNSSTQSEITTQTDSINITNSTTTIFLSNTVATNSSFEPAGDIDLVLYVAVGAAGGIMILFIVILILCAFVYRLTSSRDPTCAHIPATTPQQDFVQLQIQGTMLQCAIHTVLYS